MSVSLLVLVTPHPRVEKDDQLLRAYDSIGARPCLIVACLLNKRGLDLCTQGKRGSSLWWIVWTSNTLPKAQ